MRKKIHALLSPQGTACLETALRGNEYTANWRAKIESQFCDGGWDSPVAGTWTDVTENEAFYSEED